MFEACSQSRQAVEVEVGVLAKCFGVRAIVEAVQRSRRKPVTSGFPLRLCRLQPIAQGQQFSDLGDNSVLFGKRRNIQSQLVRVATTETRLHPFAKTVQVERLESDE